jgi:hypothetical protein
LIRTIYKQAQIYENVSPDICAFPVMRTLHSVGFALAGMMGEGYCDGVEFCYWEDDFSFEFNLVIHKGTESCEKTEKVLRIEEDQRSLYLTVGHTAGGRETWKKKIAELKLWNLESAIPVIHKINEGWEALSRVTSIDTIRENVHGFEVTIKKSSGDIYWIDLAPRRFFFTMLPEVVIHGKQGLESTLRLIEVLESGQCISQLQVILVEVEKAVADIAESKRRKILSD